MTMRVVPAVDIRGGKCVNLVQGDYARETVFAEDPLEQAEKWWRGLLDAGVLPEEAVVHVVDLDGARDGRCRVIDIVKRMSESGIRVELGGGIRTLESVQAVVNAGVVRVVLGTAAYRDPALLRRAAELWPDRIVVGLDARNGRIALQGWLEETDADPVSFARQAEKLGAVRIIYTDILSDGMMSGPNHEMTRAVAESVGIPVTMSGGVSSLEDLRAARRLAAVGVDEVIVGRALYLSRFSIAQAQEALNADN